MSDLFPISPVQDKIAQHAIFIHGLGGDPYGTWQSFRESEEYLLKWLAEDIDGLAVWTVGYKAAVSWWNGSAMHLTDRATNVLERILLEPKLKTGEIILIGHSLGGLVIKQLLRIAEGMPLYRDDANEFMKRVRRVAFLATPHAGAGLATLGDRFRILLLPSAATACLVRNDANLRDLNSWYRNWSVKHGIEHLILSETQPIKKIVLVVEPDSSDPGLSSQPIPIDADHFTICKPICRDSEVYLYIYKFLRNKLETAHRETLIEGKLIAQSAQLDELIDLTQDSRLQIVEELSALKQELFEQSERTADIVANRILAPGAIPKISTHPKYPKELVDNKIENDLDLIRRARFFREFSAVEHSIRLAEKLQCGEYEGGSDEVKCLTLAWCARLLAISEYKAKSDELLGCARQLGDTPEVTIAEAFRLSSDGKYEEALGKIVKLDSSLSRSAAFIIVANNKDAASAIDWLTKSGISFSDLDADGKYFLLTKLLEIRLWDRALEYANNVQEEDFQRAPILFHVAAKANLVQAIPDELKSFVMQQTPIEALSFPLASNETSLKSRRKAQELFYKFADVAKKLDCVEVANIAGDYAIWLELRDPEGHESGRRKLQEDMRDSTQYLRRLHFALQFGLKIDLEAVEQEIDRETTISGGKSQNAAMARFSLMFTQESPKAVAAYIDRHREQLHEHLDKKSIDLIEIEMLARAGLSQRAEERLKNLISEGLPDTESNHLFTIIAESTGADPIEARKAQFENSDKLNDLINLVNLLEEQNDWSQLCHFCSILFERTHTLADAEHLARALNEAKLYSELLAFLRSYPEFLDQSDNLQMLWSWSLYREGALADSASSLEKLRNKRDHPGDRSLTVKLAIASGDWDALVTYVESEWCKRDLREADDLISTAQLAHIVGSPRAKELMYAAVDRSANNSGVLVAAYFLATRAGWENEPNVAQWLQIASELSGDDGPIKKMSMKDLLDRAPDWNRREANLWQQLYTGSIPIFGLADLLNRSLFDMFLLPALSNITEPDVRKRIIVPAYSGVRPKLYCDYHVVAMDATALLTLGYLGILDIVTNVFTRIIIPHSTLNWLFEEKQKVSFHQPSRIKNAVKLRQMLSTGQLKKFSCSTELDADLVAEIGEELASLIAEAQAGSNDNGRQRLVIRSSPVHRVCSLMEEEADLSLYSPYLCSCQAVVNKLKQKGQLTVSEERRAQSYLALNEKEWPSQPEILDGAILYLDDLSVVYLQYAGVLEKLHSAGYEVYISRCESDEVNALLNYDLLTSEVSRIIESIRFALATGIRTGKIKVGQAPQLEKVDESESLHSHPTFSIFHLIKEAEAVIIDDRFLNQHLYFDSNNGQTPLLTTLDLLDALHAKGNLTFEQLLDYRTTLRRAGYLFIPITSDELEYYMAVTDVIDGHLVETAELKAIRENLLRIRMSRFLHLPKEALWLSSQMQVFSHTLKAQWSPAIDNSIARVRSEWLLKQLDIRGWSPCFANDEGIHIIENVYVAQIMSLMMPPMKISAETKEKYWEWIEELLLSDLKTENPEIYSLIIRRVQELISHIPDVSKTKD